jgi:hypothetical protein
MIATFVETDSFRDNREHFLPDPDYARLQVVLMTDPDSGDVIPGCGGLRKYRISDPLRSRGKRGGARLIYLHVPEAACFLMIDIYGKGQKLDMTQREKNVLSQLAEVFKREMIDRYNRWKEANTQ